MVAHVVRRKGNRLVGIGNALYSFVFIHALHYYVIIFIHSHSYQKSYNPNADIIVH